MVSILGSGSSTFLDVDPRLLKRFYFLFFLRLSRQLNKNKTSNEIGKKTELKICVAVQLPTGCIPEGNFWKSE